MKLIFVERRNASQRGCVPKERLWRCTVAYSHFRWNATSWTCLRSREVSLVARTGTVTQDVICCAHQHNNRNGSKIFWQGMLSDPWCTTQNLDLQIAYKNLLVLGKVCECFVILGSLIKCYISLKVPDEKNGPAFILHTQLIISRRCASYRQVLATSHLNVGVLIFGRSDIYYLEVYYESACN
jgi:hypothetical protein